MKKERSWLSAFVSTELGMLIGVVILRACGVKTIDTAEAAWGLLMALGICGLIVLVRGAWRYWRDTP